MHTDENRNPWTILGEKEIYDNKWIRITEYDVLNPAGGKGIYGKVHFKNLAIGVIALDDDLNTYLVGQYRFTLNQYSWEIPEGGGPHADAPWLLRNVSCWKKPGLQPVSGLCSGAFIYPIL